MEHGETPEVALRRELMEELGVEVEGLRHLTTDDTEVEGRIIRLRCFAAQLVGSAPADSTDHDEMRWCSARELTTLDWAEPDLPAVRLLSGADSA